MTKFSKTCCLKTTNTAKQHKKLKIGQKRQKMLKHTENSLERVFVTKQQNHFNQKLFIYTNFVQKRFKSVKTCLQTSIAAKQHKN